jgi:copper chaperone CopZ
MNPVLDKIWVDNLCGEESVSTIQQALMEIIGVIQVKVNAEDGWIEVEHEDFTDLASINARLTEIGYSIADTIMPIQMDDICEATTFEDVPVQWNL